MPRFSMNTTENNINVLTFIAASGLCIRELQALYVRDIVQSSTGTLWIRVFKENDHDKSEYHQSIRTVPILASHKQEILQTIQGRHPDEKIFPDVIRKRLKGEKQLRKQYARALYYELIELLYGVDEPLALNEYYEPMVYTVAYALDEPLGKVVKTYLNLSIDA